MIATKYPPLLRRSISSALPNQPCGIGDASNLGFSGEEVFCNILRYFARDPPPASKINDRQIPANARTEVGIYVGFLENYQSRLWCFANLIIGYGTTIGSCTF